MGAQELPLLTASASWGLTPLPSSLAWWAGVPAGGSGADIPHFIFSWACMLLQERFKEAYGWMKWFAELTLDSTVETGRANGATKKPPTFRADATSERALEREVGKR